MADLITRPNLPDPDGFYADLIKAYEVLDEEAVNAFSARLILLLTNHIGDWEVISQAVEEAARTNLNAEK